MAAHLADDVPAGLLKRLHRLLAGNVRKSRHAGQTETRISGWLDGGIWAIAFWSSAHSQAEIASLMLARASCSSLPCETHPGRAGHSATNQPSSALVSV